MFLRDNTKRKTELKMDKSLNNFLTTQLSILLGFEIPPEMIANIASLTTENETKTYLEELLDVNDVKQKQLIRDVINRKFPKANKNIRNKLEKEKTQKRVEQPIQTKTIDKNVVALPRKDEKLKDLEQEYAVSKKEPIPVAITETAKKRNRRNKNKPTSPSDIPNDTEPTSIENYEKDVLDYYQEKTRDAKTQYERFAKCHFDPHSHELQLPVLHGRRYCGCFGRHHQIVSNCLNCGRIACEQERSGPCVFCGELVCSRQEREVLFGGTDESVKLARQLMNLPKPVGWETALENSKRLLDSDKMRAERLQIIDDQIDYYQVDVDWENIRKLIDESHAKVDEALKNATGIVYDDRQRLQDVAKYEIYKIAGITNDVEQFLATMNVLRDVALRDKPSLLDPRVDDALVTRAPGNWDMEREFWELMDDLDPYGVCVSIRQPWASLIMAGIKRCEVRSWPTDYRGVIWIASAAYEPSTKEINEAQKFYRKYYEDPDLPMPQSYPCGRLLGRANLTYCYTEEEYLANYPNGEAEGAYMFVLDEVIPLKMSFPLKGCDGLYLLPKKLHTVAGLLVREYLRENPEFLEG